MTLTWILLHALKSLPLPDLCSDCLTRLGIIQQSAQFLGSIFINQSSDLFLAFPKPAPLAVSLNGKSREEAEPNNFKLNYFPYH